MARKIFQECFAETYLVNLLGYNKPSHCKGIGEVFNKLKKSKGVPTIGFVDGDKNMPKEFMNFKKERSSPDNSIEIYKRDKSLVVVQNPDFENWIFNIAKKEGLLKKNGKIKNAKDLKVITKQSVVRLNNNKEFVELMEKIKFLEDSPFKIIKEAIEET